MVQLIAWPIPCLSSSPKQGLKPSTLLNSLSSDHLMIPTLTEFHASAIMEARICVTMLGLRSGLGVTVSASMFAQNPFSSKRASSCASWGSASSGGVSRSSTLKYSVMAVPTFRMNVPRPADISAKVSNRASCGGADGRNPAAPEAIVLMPASPLLAAAPTPGRKVPKVAKTPAVTVSQAPELEKSLDSG